MPRVVIVGAGVIGLCAAREMRRRGWEVVVLDARRPGAGASHGNAGWVVPGHAGPVPRPGLVRTSMRWMLRSDSPLYIQPRADVGFARWLLAFWRSCNARAYGEGLTAIARLNRRTFALFDQLEQEGLEFEQRRDGMLFVYLDRAGIEHDLRDLEALAPYGFEPPAILEGDALHAFEPSLSDCVAAGLHVAAERHLRPDRFVAVLADRLASEGVEIRSGSPVTGFVRRAGAVTGVETPTKTEAADAVLIAAGAWTGQVARLAGVRLPIEAGKGYSLDFAPAPIAVGRPLSLHEARVAVTPFAGAVRLAGTMEFSGINERIRPERVAAIARAAATFLRGWSPDPAEATTIWTGMRPMTPDGLPAIGLLPGFGNLAVASGHAMLGLTLAPATGEAVAELLTTGRAPDVLGPFDPARFARRR
jgi:D-amino-acid dehydrogenase